MSRTNRLRSAGDGVLLRQAGCSRDLPVKPPQAWAGRWIWLLGLLGILVGSTGKIGCSRCEFRDFASFHEGLTAVACSPRLPVAASGSGRGTLKVWDFTTHEEIASFSELEEVHCLAFSPDGNYLVSGGYYIIVWDTADWEERLRFQANSLALAIAFGRDSSTVVTSQITGEVHLWDVNTGERLKSVRAHETPVEAIAVCPKGNLLATGDYEGKIRVGRLDTLEEIAKVTAHAGAVCSLAFSDKDMRLASAGADGAIRIWEPTQLRELACWRADNSWTLAVVFSRNGEYLISGGLDRRIKIWKVSSGKEVFSCRPDPHCSPQFLAVSAPTSRLLIGLCGCMLKSMKVGEQFGL